MDRVKRKSFCAFSVQKILRQSAYGSCNVKSEARAKRTGEALAIIEKAETVASNFYKKNPDFVDTSRDFYIN